MIGTYLDQKPKRPQHLRDYALEPRTPISPSELKPFHWHVGRVLEGKVTSWSATMSGNLQCVCKSTSDCNNSTSHQIPFSLFVTCRFPELQDYCGMTVTILDPYFKIDRGTGTVRVDCASDIQFALPKLPPSLSIEAEKKHGDNHLNNNRPTEALVCYWRVLRGECNGSDGVHENVKLVTTLLNKLSFVLLELEKYDESLFAASAVLLIEPQNQEASLHYNECSLKLASKSDDEEDESTSASATSVSSTPSKECDITSRVLLFDGDQLPHFRSSINISTTEIPTEVTANDLKEKGDDAVAAEKYEEAMNFYLQALKNPQFKILGNLFSNMGNAYSRIDFHQLVLITSALASFFNPDLKNKNMMRYSLSLQHLHCTTESLKLEKNVDFSTDPTSVSLFSQIREEQAGKYDFVSFCSQKKNEKKVPFTNFVSSALKVAQIPGKGRGLVATRNIEAGELLIVERALAASTQTEVSSTMTYGNTILTAHDQDMFRQLQTKCALPGSGVLLHDIYSLCNTDAQSQSGTFDITSHANSWRKLPFREPFALELGFDLGRICESLSENGFALDDRRPPKPSALFLIPSFINHPSDFSSNLHRRSFENVYFFFASRNITCGEELTVMYFSFSTFMENPRRCLSKWKIPDDDEDPHIDPKILPFAKRIFDCESGHEVSVRSSSEVSALYSEVEAKEMPQHLKFSLLQHLVTESLLLVRQSTQPVDFPKEAIRFCTFLAKNNFVASSNIVGFFASVLTALREKKRIQLQPEDAKKLLAVVKHGGFESEHIDVVRFLM